MFFQFFVVLIAVGATAGHFRECLEPMQKKCQPGKLPRQFPSTLEDMRRDCDNAVPRIQCIKDSFETCPEADNEVLEEVEAILNTLKEACNEDHDTFKVLSSHISCVGPLYNHMEDVCSSHSLTEEEQVMFRPIISGEKRELLSCGSEVRMIMCSSTAIAKRCGEELKDLMADLRRKLSPQYAKECTPDKLNDLQPYIEAYENLLSGMDFSSPIVINI